LKLLEPAWQKLRHEENEILKRSQARPSSPRHSFREGSLEGLRNLTSERSGSLPLLEQVRVEVYLPDLPSTQYQNLLRSFEEELTYAFGGSTIVRGFEGRLSHFPQPLRLGLSSPENGEKPFQRFLSNCLYQLGSLLETIKMVSASTAPTSTER
jgi:hypothetical protein